MGPLASVALPMRPLRGPPDPTQSSPLTEKWANDRVSKKEERLTKVKPAERQKQLGKRAQRVTVPPLGARGTWETQKRKF